jgi:hypothetical protein
MQTILRSGLVFLCILQATPVHAQSTKIAEDRQREAAIAEFTAKTKAANYPALFEKAAAEFNVPADILKGIAFAETRWEHLTWPAGETRSPETGMPRPFGIMSLWDNEFFGHSLTDAAKLIGKDPGELKNDPLNNIRGAAALLRKIYDETPKPNGTTEQDIESWRYAIVKYCGVPEPDLSNRHALDVYEFMNKGYNQYGIEWPARPVNLGPMREEVKRIVAVEDAKHQAQMRTEELTDKAQAAPPTFPKSGSLTTAQKDPGVEIAVVTPPTPAQLAKESSNTRWLILGVLAALVSGILLWRMRSRKDKPRQ